MGIYAINTPDDLAIIGEKFRQLVKNTEVMHNDLRLNVSVSVGISAVQAYDTVETLIERADALMYRSKKDGKNRVTVG